MTRVLKKKNIASPLHLNHIELCAVCLSILRINLIHLKKHKQFVKSLVRTVANRILVKPAVPLELDCWNTKRKYKNLNLCTT